MPLHPGEILREDVLPQLKISRARLARKLDISTRRLEDILEERASVTKPLARKLGLVVGYGGRYWLGLQLQHDLWRGAGQGAVAAGAVPAGQGSHTAH